MIVQNIKISGGGVPSNRGDETSVLLPCKAIPVGKQLAFARVEAGLRVIRHADKPATSFVSLAEVIPCKQ